MICPLCLGSETQIFDQDKSRSYHQCANCSLVFVPRTELISLEEEKNRYESHENSEEDPQYLNYLAEIADSIVPMLVKGSTGLDFGCGKTLILEKILGERGYPVDSFDIFFHPGNEIFDKKFDFIILSEVIEHLRNPYEELKKLSLLLNQGGYFFIKTKLIPSTREDFANWFYKRDKTHVQFFSADTFKAMDAIFNLQDGKLIGKDLFCFRHN